MQRSTWQRSTCGGTRLCACTDGTLQATMPPRCSRRFRTLVRTLGNDPSDLSEIKLRRQPFVYRCEQGGKFKVSCRRGTAEVGNFAETPRLIADMVPQRFVVPGSGRLRGPPNVALVRVRPCRLDGLSYRHRCCFVARNEHLNGANRRSEIHLRAISPAVECAKSRRALWPPAPRMALTPGGSPAAKQGDAAPTSHGIYRGFQ